MNRMRNHLAVYFIQGLSILSLASFAQAAELPDDARQLLEKRDEAVRKIDRRFAEELEKLKVAHTKRGDLESANAIVALIDKYKVDQSTQKDSATQINRLAGDWKRDYDSSLFEFDAEGGGVWGGRDKFRVIYDPKMDHFELRRPQWDINTIRFSAAGDTLIGTIKGGRSYTLTRIK